MYKFLLGLALSLFCANANAQDFWYNGSPTYYNQPPVVVYRYIPQVTYVPVVQWYPTGTWLNTGPVVVSPDRRYVRFGINTGFTDIRSVETFSFYNGYYLPYPR